MDLRSTALTTFCAFVGTAVGALLVQQIDSTFLQRLTPVLLIALALLLFSPHVIGPGFAQRIGAPAFAPTIGTGVAFTPSLVRAQGASSP